jgi:hypothetical protein
VDVETVIVIIGAYLLAGVVKGATGLGFSTTCLPLLALAIGLKDALPLVIIPSVSSNVLIMRTTGHFRETVRRFWPLYAALLPGLAAGLAALALVDGSDAAVVLGVVLILYGAYALARAPVRLPEHLERPLAPVTGLLTGFVNGLTGSQVMPVLPYMFALQLDPNRLVQAINCSFTLSSLVMAAGLSHLALFDLHDVAVSVAGIVPALGGTRIGAAVRARLHADTFRTMVLVVLVLLGAALIGKSYASFI